MKYPLALIASFYLVGLLLARFWEVPPVMLLSAGAVLIGGAIFSGRARPWLLCALLVVCGWINLGLNRWVVAADDLRILVGGEACVARVRGLLCEEAALRIYERRGESLERSVVRIRVTHVAASGGSWRTARGTVFASVRGRLPADYGRGSRVEAEGVLARPDPPAAPGLFDWRKYLEREGIYYQLRTAAISDWVRAELRRNPWDNFAVAFTSWAQRVLAAGLPDDLSVDLIKAMSLGWKGPLPGHVYRPFMESGTMHVFAISGLHIALIASILVTLLRALRIGRGICAWLVLPLIWFYTGATGWQPSAIRSAVMMSVVIVGWGLRRPGNLLNSLAGAAVIVLLWEPEQLFGASFQLSFLVVLSMAVLLPVFEQLLGRCFRRDEFLAVEYTPAWQRLLEERWRPFRATISTSLAAWLGSIPLIAYYFNMANPVALIANLAIVPLSGIALACNMGSLFSGAFGITWFVMGFNHCAWGAMWLMIKLSAVAAGWDWAWFYVPKPGVPGIATYYVVLVGLAWSVWRRPPGVRWAFAALLCAGIAAEGARIYAHRGTQLTILPLERGYGLFVDAPGKRWDCLVDTGSTNCFTRVVEPFLRGQGVNRVRSLVLSHGDSAHIGAAETAARSLQPQEIFVSNVKFRSAAYRRAVESFGEKRDLLKRVNTGGLVGPWKMCYPLEGRPFGVADDNAMVLQGQFNGTRVIVLSDLGRQGQDALLARGSDLRADVVIAGVPSEGEPLRSGLLEAIRPRLIIIADDDYPPAARAKETLMKRLTGSGISVLQTSKTGAVTLRCRGGGAWEYDTAELP
jgi:ComEC/Rec2-related protein